MEQHGFDVAVASSGTAETLTRIAHASTGAEPLRTYNCATLSRDELDAVVDELVRHRTAAARRTKVRGLEAARADIIVAGALILQSVAEAFGVDAFTYSEAALREGVLVDTVSRMNGAAGPLHHLRDVSRRSIDQLALRCDDDPKHSAHVARLAVALFDGLGAGARARRRRPGVPGGRRAAGQRRARRGPFEAPPARLLRDPQQRAGRPDGHGDRGHRPDRQVPPQERAQARPRRVRRSLRRRPAAGAHAGRHPAGGHRAGPQPSGRRARRRGAPGGRSVSSCSSRPSPAHRSSLELHAANERRALLEQVLGRPVLLRAR